MKYKDSQTHTKNQNFQHVWNYFEMFVIVLDLQYCSESALIAQTRFYIFIFDIYDKQFSLISPQISVVGTSIVHQ